eukprot:8949033-Ditylum_brightwellii.AAC.1
MPSITSLAIWAIDAPRDSIVSMSVGKGNACCDVVGRDVLPKDDGVKAEPSVACEIANNDDMAMLVIRMLSSLAVVRQNCVIKLVTLLKNRHGGEFADSLLKAM